MIYTRGQKNADTTSGGWWGTAGILELERIGIFM